MSFDIAGIGILAAFLAGAISFLSPCVLPLVPGYVSFIAGQTARPAGHRAALSERLSAVGLSLCFVLGFSTVFVLLGAGVGTLGQLLLARRAELGLVGGAILTVGASSAGTADAVGLLAVYSAGLGVPFLLTALFTDAIARRIRGIGRTGRLLYRAAGVLMVVMGIAVMTGQLSRLAWWLLNSFPVLGRIG